MQNDINALMARFENYVTEAQFSMASIKAEEAERNGDSFLAEYKSRLENYAFDNGYA